MAIYKNYQFPVRICVKPNQFLYVQAAASLPDKKDNDESSIIEFYICTVTHLLMKEIDWLNLPRKWSFDSKIPEYLYFSIHSFFLSSYRIKQLKFRLKRFYQEKYLYFNHFLNLIFIDLKYFFG